MTKTQSTSLVLEVGDVEDGKNPMYVECADCGHDWIGLYLPQPISTAAKMMKNLTCPKCGAGSMRIRVRS
jgi:Zn finger protein HypA/HybF involved in hydrogenase expression